MSDNNETVVVDRGGSSGGNGGWAVAVVILVVVVAGIFLWMHYGAAPAADSGGLDVNVTVPAGSGQEAGPAE